jgi:hypothetical protein
MDLRRCYKSKNPGSSLSPVSISVSILLSLSCPPSSSSSSARDVLEQLKYNMDLCCIKTFALFRICNRNIIRRIELDENIQNIQIPTDGETEIRILFRSWICDEEGKFERSALQDGCREKRPNTALWLKYIEATFMVTSGKYLLTEDEALMLGCLKLQVSPLPPPSVSLCLCLSPPVSLFPELSHVSPPQADSGDYNHSVHTIAMLQTRICQSFPAPIKDKMKNLLLAADKNKNKKTSSVTSRGEDATIAERVKLLYSRLAGEWSAQSNHDSRH